MSEAIKDAPTVEAQNGNEGGGVRVGAEQRRTPRHEHHFTCTIEGRDGEGRQLSLSAVSTMVSPGGASFSLTRENASVLERLTVGQEVTVVTTLARLRGEVNGKWLEPKEPGEGVRQRPHVGVRLLDNKTWV
jgi:hypothetical protein